MTRLRALLLLALAGCFPAAPALDGERLLALRDPERGDEAFQSLLREGSFPIPALRAALGLGAERGYPVVALLYAQGRGDAVPVDLRAAHLARFEWPRATAAENAVVEPFVRAEIEQDLARAGRPALRALGRAFVEQTPSEEAATRVLRTMLRIGGHGAAEEFARVLALKGPFEAPWTKIGAATALLYIGKQELALRIAPREDRIEAARRWWELAKDFPASEWIRESADALAAKYQPRDPEGVKPVFELLVGRPVEDPKAWWEKNRDWRPAPAPLRPEELLPALSGDRARAWDANRRLEEATGMRVDLPRMERISDLAAALRLWRPPADLERRWRRWLEAPLLRLSVAAIGSNPPRIRWATEVFFHPTEEESGELRIETRTESYHLFVQALDLGTRLVASEAHGMGGLWTGELREFREGRPMLMFSAPFKSALVAVVEEVSERRPPPHPEPLREEWRARLRGMAELPDALKALGYFQDEADLELLKTRKAGAALLLLGDPAALELRPRLAAHEIEIALRKAEDPRVRAYLEELRTSLPR